MFLLFILFSSSDNLFVNNCYWLFVGKFELFIYLFFLCCYLLILNFVLVFMLRLMKYYLGFKKIDMI